MAIRRICRASQRVEGPCASSRAGCPGRSYLRGTIGSGRRPVRRLSTPTCGSCVFVIDALIRCYAVFLLTSRTLLPEHLPRFRVVYFRSIALANLVVAVPVLWWVLTGGPFEGMFVVVLLVSAGLGNTGWLLAAWLRLGRSTLPQNRIRIRSTAIGISLVTTNLTLASAMLSLGPPLACILIIAGLVSAAVLPCVVVGLGTSVIIRTQRLSRGIPASSWPPE